MSSLKKTSITSFNECKICFQVKRFDKDLSMIESFLKLLEKNGHKLFNSEVFESGIINGATCSSEGETMGKKLTNARI